MNDEGRTTGLRMGRFSRVLVVAELAVSFGLLVMAGLVVQSLSNIARADFGFAMADVFSARLSLPTRRLSRRGAPPAVPGRGARTDCAQLPGVQRVAFGTGVPLGGTHYAIKLPDRQYASDRDYHDVHGIVASPDYFACSACPWSRAAPSTSAIARAARRRSIVNQAFVRRYYPRTARLAASSRWRPGAHQEWREIVGVVPDLGMGETPGDEVPEAIYLPMPQMPSTSFSILAQASRGAAQPVGACPRRDSRPRRQPSPVQPEHRRAAVRSRARGRSACSARCSWPLAWRRSSWRRSASTA